MMYEMYSNPVLFVFVLLLVVIWSLIWKGLGLWHSAGNRQKAWFVVMLIFNTLGLLPIIYLLWFKPKENMPLPAAPVKKKVEKKLAKKKVVKKVKKKAKKKK